MKCDPAFPFRRQHFPLASLIVPLSFYSFFDFALAVGMPGFINTVYCLKTILVTNVDPTLLVYPLKVDDFSGSRLNRELKDLLYIHPAKVGFDRFLGSSEVCI